MEGRENDKGEIDGGKLKMKRGEGKLEKATE